MEMLWLFGAEVPGFNPASPSKTLGAAGSLCNTVKSLARWGNLDQGPNKYFFKLALLHCPFKAVPVL